MTVTFMTEGENSTFEELATPTLGDSMSRSLRLAAEAMVPWIAWVLIAALTWYRIGPGTATGAIVAALVAWSHRTRIIAAWPVSAACVLAGGAIDLTMTAVAAQTADVLRTSAVARGITTWTAAAGAYELVSRMGKATRLLAPRAQRGSARPFVAFVAFGAMATQVTGTVWTALLSIASVVGGLVALGATHAPSPRSSAVRPTHGGLTAIAAGVTAIAAIAVGYLDNGFVSSVPASVAGGRVDALGLFLAMLPLLSALVSALTAMLLLMRAHSIRRNVHPQRERGLLDRGMAQLAAGWAVWALLSGLGGYAVFKIVVQPAQVRPAQCPGGGVPPDGMDC